MQGSIEEQDESKFAYVSLFLLHSGPPRKTGAIFARPACIKKTTLKTARETIKFLLLFYKRVYILHLESDAVTATTCPAQLEIFHIYI